jgi:YD repeat-containing protein
MSAASRRPDKSVQRILKTLIDQYGSQHPSAKVEAYRYNSASIRIRITDPDFKGLDRVEREEAVWPIIETLPEDDREQITVLLLITPKEKKSSFMSMEFDNPVRSSL